MIRWRCRRLLVGVEPIQQGTLQRLRDLSEQIHIVNGYGPTETTVCATLFPFHSATEPDRRTPIGTRIRGYEVYLVDTNKQPVPLGMPGELLIGGAGLARGYINHPELTAEYFIPIPSALSQEHVSTKLVTWPATCRMATWSFSVAAISR